MSRGGGAKVVVKWSACLHSTLTISVPIEKIPNINPPGKNSQTTEIPKVQKLPKVPKIQKSPPCKNPKIKIPMLQKVYKMQIFDVTRILTAKRL